jgi:rhodanese-related sulfurtransferase
MLRIITLLICIGYLNASAQYKNDNVSFKTIDPSAVCTNMQQQKNYLLLDVRSKGEHYDTSSFGSNIGHLKGAKNIDVRELGDRISEISQYKNSPVYVYCSHSQRSRRASKMLADSGFTNVININGGMTAFYYTNAIADPCIAALIETVNTYKLLSPVSVCKQLNDKNVFLLDVRADSAFRHISTSNRANAYGSFRNSVNIPLDQLEKRLNEVPAGKEIVVVDLYGNDAATAASILNKNGYKNISVLIEGMDRWLNSSDEEVTCKTSAYTSPVTYKLMSAVEVGGYLKKNKDVQFVDIRSSAEFSNQHTDYWRNIGNIKSAVSIPIAKFSEQISSAKLDKSKPVLVYDFGNSNDVHTAALLLQQKGFTNVNVLIGGLFNLRWTAANRSGQKDLATLVTNVPEINW